MVTPLGFLASCHDTFHRTSKKTVCECVQFIIFWGQNLFTSSHAETRLPYEGQESSPHKSTVTIYLRVKTWF